MSLRRAGDRWLQLSILNEEIPSKRESSARADYVPALCTHRPSLLPIGCLARVLDRSSGGQQCSPEISEKSFQLDHLEEVKVVTRFP